MQTSKDKFGTFFYFSSLFCKFKKYGTDFQLVYLIPRYFPFLVSISILYSKNSGFRFFSWTQLSLNIEKKSISDTFWAIFYRTLQRLLHFLPCPGPGSIWPGCRCNVCFEIPTSVHPRNPVFLLQQVGSCKKHSARNHHKFLFIFHQLWWILFYDLKKIQSNLEEMTFSIPFHLVLLGAYHDRTTQSGITLSDQMTFGSIVATNLVIVVTAQVIIIIFTCCQQTY